MRLVSTCVLLAARGALELCVVAAWSALTLAMITERHYPFALAVGVFVNGVALTRFCSGHRLRFRGPFQAAGALLVVLYTLHWVVSPTRSFANMFWVAEVVKHQPSAAAWRVAAAFSCWTIAFWVAACRFAVRADGYLAVCARFDRGMLWLFVLLLVKLLLRQQVGVWRTEDGSDALVLPFFVCGVTAIALARNQSDARRHFLRGRRGVGVLVAFMGFVTAGGLGVMLLCLPYLHSASELGYDKLAAFAGPFGPFLVELIQFFLRGRMWLPLPSKKPLVSSSGSPSPLNGRQLADAAASGTTMFWLIVCAILIAGVVVWAIRRWRVRPPIARAGRSWLAAWLAWIGAWVRSWRARWQGYLARRRQARAIRLYRGLLAWGRHTGLPVRASETPLEYGRRLQRQVTRAGANIDPIVALFNAHVYGSDPSAELARAARQALRRLRSPRLWPQRVAAWLDGQGVAASKG
ncbi:MAG: DUF4129 domain-containing protein [Polyangiales bacterium]